MLAEPPLPMGDHTNLDISDALMAENRICPGCRGTVVTEDGGVVVAFGQSFFHVDCFKCAKCNNQVTADTNLLLLSDGSPVCANCSYCCNVCGLPILDEAIMTGDDSYHAHCFNCKVCKKRIDELVFAKTSQGIYCMDCHNERVARSRRHQQRKEKEKARERAAAEASIRSRENTHREPSQGVANGRTAVSPELSTAPQPNNSLASRSRSTQSQGGPSSPRSSDQTSGGAPILGKRDSTSSTGERRTLTQSPPPIGNTVSLPTQSPPMPSNLAAPALSNNKRYSTLALPRPSSSQPRAGTAPLGAVPGATLSAPLQDHLRSTSSPMPRSETLDVPSDRSSKPLQKRRSFDDRPLNVLLQDSVNTIPSFTNPSPNGNLLPPETTARRDKRRSINPAVAMSFNSPPQSSSPTATSFSGSHTVPVQPEVPPNRVSSPREVFSAPRTLSPSPLQDGSYPPVSPPHSYPSHLVPIRPLPDPLTGRARSASASTFVDISRSPGPDRPNTPNRQDATLDKVPTRTSSRGDFHARPATSGGLRSQNSFDERSRSGTPTFHSRPSSLNQTIEIPMRSRSSSGPASPAHHVDVPHSIESGTDTEGEKEEDLRRHSRNGTEPTSELPPLPPPKEGKGSKVGTRPPELKLGPSDIDNDNSDTGPPDSEDISELSHESSPVEQTSHATFIAPALPPIRFSMSGADFSDLLKSVGTHQSNKSLERVPEVTGDGTSRNRAIAANTPPSTARTATPTSDITVLAPGEPGVDVAPMKRNEARRNGRSETDQTPRRNQSLPRSGSPSPDSSPSSSNDHTMTIGRSRDTSDAPKRSLDLSELSGVSDASRSSVDLPASGHSRTLSNVRNGLPARPAPEGRSSHQRSATAVALSGSATEANGPAQITVTSPDNATSKLFNKLDTSDLVRRRLQEAVGEATNRGATHVKLNMEFINAILMLLEQRKDEYNDMSRRLDGMKRASQQYMDGLSVAQTEYDLELMLRREAEAEVRRLRVLLSGQAARLTAITGESRRQEAQKQLSREMSNNLSTLERDLSKLKAERDMTLAEVEELATKKGVPSVSDDEVSAPNVGRALSVRFDNIKSQYLQELTPLTERREALLREISELKASRNAFLEETTILNARNEELASLNAQYTRRVEPVAIESATSSESGSQDKHEMTKPPPPGLNVSSTSSTVAFSEESIVKVSKPEHSEAPASQFKPKFITMKWGASKAPKEHIAISWPEGVKRQTRAEHTFQQTGVLRVSRCDHCGDKMWGSQLRCQDCGISVHTRCVHHVNLSCAQHQSNGNGREDMQGSSLGLVGPSMFGRDLAEQVRADSKEEQRLVPVIVEKCIDAVDFLGLEYEGIYRKTGGSRLSKLITQLFERGDYDSFDLRDTERFNDICSITSVLKTYFRSLPVPLFTFNLHDKFVAAACNKDVAAKSSCMQDLITELPHEHYHTTRALMLHLHRVCEQSETNLMHARNLGVVFGPTLMRSSDPSAEFSDMAGKALCVEWMVENAPSLFERSSSPSA